MRTFAIELLLCLSLVLIVWAIKDTLQRLEAELDNDQRQPAPPSTFSRMRFATPQDLFEPMGRYLDQTIYRYAIIDGRHYRFEHVCPASQPIALQATQRWIAPGLVYVESPAPLPA